jgi:hypothetical protein
VDRVRGDLVKRLRLPTWRTHDANVLAGHVNGADSTDADTDGVIGVVSVDSVDLDNRLPTDVLLADGQNSAGFANRVQGNLFHRRSSRFRFPSLRSSYTGNIRRTSPPVNTESRK